jgi:CubicO group peptidase (beta-lactamase class C family)
MARLARMHDVMAGYVERGEVPGLVTLISRRGEVHVDVIGTQAVDDSRPMQRGTIFRISSMTKPITAAATMILVEECKLRLDEPVDALLTFRMGFGQMMVPPDAYPILSTANEQRIGMGPPSPASMPAPDAWMRRLGRLPLMHQPGKQWMYNTGSDVLGMLIARASGQPLETFLREHLTAGMAAWVPPGIPTPGRRWSPS